MKIKKFYLKDVKSVKLKKKSINHSTLTVINDFDIDFKIRRVFTVSSGNNEERGDHAHYKCSQFLFCVQGSIDVELYDGIKKKKIKLDNNTKGIIIPPTIWSKQIYKNKNSVLIVCCDIYYNENEYINDINKFENLKSK